MTKKDMIEVFVVQLCNENGKPLASKWVEESVDKTLTSIKEDFLDTLELDDSIVIKINKEQINTEDFKNLPEFVGY